MTHGSLFSGIGGFDLAAQWMGWQNIFHCEINPFGQRHLKFYWPDSISYNDIMDTDFSVHRGTIDILSGGFPCQPYSSAGKRLGKADERHLWPYMLRAIQQIQPRWIVGENVYGLTNWNGGLVFNEVQTDLEAEGYEVQPVLLPAASVNAPHNRQRVFFIAHSKFNSNSGNTGTISSTADQANTGRQEPSTTSEQQVQLPFEPSHVFRNATDTNLQRCNECSSNWQERHIPIDINRDATNTDTERLERRRREWSRLESISRNRNWDKFPTQSPICSRNDGISDKLDGITFSKWRNESIKAYGNAVVPQVVLQIFKTIQAYEDLIQNNQNP
jgi:DNA (cytosine-5)-methyltransferase 1